MANEVWAAKVTYHVLTLPINNDIYHMKTEVSGWRLEAIKVVVDNADKVGLPSHYKSPLATDFKYYKASDIVNGGKAAALYDNNGATKGVCYKVKGVDTDDTPAPTPVEEVSDITETEYYVTYSYKTSNTILQLDGSMRYNLKIKNKGFLAYNRGRNNRPAVVPNNVNPEILASEDFVKIESPGGNIATYWDGGSSNKNKKDEVGSQFHFMFKFEGVDPYNIIICTAYNRDITYIEKNDGISPDQFVYKWYKEGSLFAVKTANSYIASDEHKRYKTAYNSTIPNPTNPTYDDRPGNYHGQNGVIWGTVALLNNSNSSGYVFMGTRTVDENGNPPTPSNNKYNYLKFDNNNLTFGQQTLDEVSSNYSTEGIYPIKKVTFKVPTPFYTVEPTEAHIVSVSDWVSQYTVDNDPIETKYLPVALKRKYCDFDGVFYKDAARTQKITKFSQANYDETEGYQVYLGYEVAPSIPFKAITPVTSYSDNTWKAATWYEFTDKDDTANKKIKYDENGDPNKYFKNNGASTTYEKVSEFAFIGDPYELRVISRSQTSGASPSYVGAAGGTPASGIEFTASTDATAGYKWEIPYDATEGSFLLQLYKGVGNWYWDTEGTDQNVAYSTANSTRLKVLELPKYTYFYNIVDKSGRIAVKASIEQPIFSPLLTSVSPTSSSLPPIIVSPYLVGETLTFYDDTYTDGDGRRSLSSVITETPAVNNQNIYVTYTTAHLDDKPINLSEDQEFNVRLNGEYIWYDATDNSIKTNAAPTQENLESEAFLWKLRQRDPYAMIIDNLGARADLWGEEHKNDKENVDVYNDAGVSVQDDGTTPATVDPDTRPLRQVGGWVKLSGALPTTSDGTALAFDTDRANAQLFIAKSSLQSGVYEVMVATGVGVDAATTYYHIGRTTQYGIKIYDKTHHKHGDDELRFKLEQSVGYIYHLIDKSNHELLKQTNQSPELNLPEEYQSPLVATYHYYDIRQFTITDGVYTLKPDATELDDIDDLDATYEKVASNSSEYDNAVDDAHRLNADDVTDMEAQAKVLTNTEHPYYFKVGEDYYRVTLSKPFYTDIYVTYDKNDLVKFNDDASPYLLKFLDPFNDGYFLEDGNDKLTTERIQAVYPYTNGDGSLNIYGEAMNEEQMGGGAATRPRWVWFFDSDHDDPYHVKIHSKSTISYNSVSHPTYLQTYAVHFKQDANVSQQRVITVGMLPGIASVLPTEYMILGVEGRYKLLTANPVEADLNGDGDTEDANENDRQYITSLEQYWKTYNMAKLHVLGISKSTNAFSNDESTWVVPTADDPSTGGVDESTYRATLVARNWHSYDVIANATRWNGYNDKSDGHEKKVVENMEHWFQTFDMGDGTFDIENANIPPVLVLLDRHGWEIMRRPLPIAAYPEGDELEDLRVYDSPMVDKYYFYSNATKASGCHKYSLRLDSKTKAERDQIKVNGEHYTSTSLGDLPPITATGVVSGGVIQDFYVTYTVKEEYEKSYKYKLDYTEVKDDDGKVIGYEDITETGTPSKFVIVQNGRYARKEINSDKSYLSKPVPQATSPTGGNVYDMILNPSQVTVGNIIVDTNADGIIDDDNLWYVQPNLNIDNEMGIVWGTAISGAEPLSEVATKVAYKDKTGFDPYNLQLKNALSDNRFYTSDISSTRLQNGIWEGTLDSNGIELKTATTSGYVTPEGYDHTILQITNQTFMAVSDANGNMQLMPRFDHTKRINVTSGGSSRTTLQDPVDHDLAVVTDNASMGPQTVFMVRPQKFEYHIIDHDGNEALRYKTAGEYSPSIPDRFRSPLATDFKYYYGVTEKEISEVGDYATQWESAEETYKRTSLTNELVTSQANYLPAIGDYYFRIGTNPASYTYKKVTVTEVKEINQLFADAGLDADVNQVYVRYRYWEEADIDQRKVLQGKWFTINLANKDVQSTETTINAAGNNVFLYADDAETPTKEAPIDGTDGKRKWQWKFLASPTDISSPYYRPIDPYAIQIFNRKANYTTDMTIDPSPMSIGVKVDGYDRFALLSHPNEGYALVVAGLGLDTYSYSYLNGADMTTPSTTAASIVEECYQKSVNEAAYDALKTELATGPNAVYYVKRNGTEVDDKPKYNKVTVTAGEVAEETSNATEWEKSYISIGAQLILNDDVTHTYTYNVITNVDSGSKLAVCATQSNDEASGAGYVPVLPNSIQSPLLNMDDYKYYGSASVTGSTYTVADETKLFTLLGLYDDVVYVRYEAYDRDKTEYKVPNMRNAKNTGTISVSSDSKTASLNISGGLPYNIIWEGDKMMTSTNGSIISDGLSHDLDGSLEYVWRLFGDDPYAIQIRHGSNGNYATGSTALSETPEKTFMLLKNEDYEYGILQVTGTTGDDSGKKLTGFGGELTADASTDPKYFIIFGLSVHDLIYHLVIARTCTESEKASAVEGDQKVTIPVRTTESGPLTNVPIYGTTQRDLKTIKDDSNPNKAAGDKYQLGETISWGGVNHTYSLHAGQLSIGGDLQIPTVFYRPNCTFEYYIAGIYDGSTGEELTTLESKYKGLKLANEKLMSDAELINHTVVVNIVYKFNQELATNSGLDFVKSKDQNLWYTFETYNGSTPYLAHYTNAWGLQSMEGRETRYTNDYLWTPLGDPYGFKMYNRYMIKNSGASNKVMTTSNASFSGGGVEGTKLKMEEPGVGSAEERNAVFELLTGDVDGYFRVHPVVNNTGTQYYVKRYNNTSIPDYDGGGSDLDYIILSTTPCDWTFGLDMTLLEPYYIQAGYIGGLTTTPKAGKEKSGKELYEDALEVNIMEIQKVVYDDDNIVDFSPGYYRLHSMPGTPGISTIRYASGYLHKLEGDVDGNGNESDAIPMHFYSKVGTNTTFGSSGLKKGYTKTFATQGDIPVPATEYDPSTIFYLDGDVNPSDVADGVNPRVIMSTQGLYVKGNATDLDHGDAVMTATEANATTFSLIGIGGAVFLITDKLDPPTRSYLHYGQDYKKTIDDEEVNMIYDLKYFHNSPTNEARWCIEPANNKGLMVTTNNGGDDYYYTTFYAPYDVVLPDDDGRKKYNAYIGTSWSDTNVRTAKVTKEGYTDGKFIPAGTPVIIRTTDESANIKLTIPTTEPSVALSPRVFSGSYLEQLLDVDAAHDVYTLGLPFKSEVTKDNDYNTTGDINAPVPEQANTGVGFYINANPNKEAEGLQSLWMRNNRYVIHNKIYYRASASSARETTRGVEFVPVIFDDDEGDPEQNGVTEQRVGDGSVYDLLGRKVATEQQAKDGTWRQYVAPGIYIVHGKKVKR